ncbi:hypothetical protein STEG23_012301, partial [Scotinomys teguina]
MKKISDKFIRVQRQADFCESEASLVYSELQDGIGQRQPVVKTLNTTGEEIIQQSSKTDANILQDKLGSLSLRWQEICKQLSERKK